MARMTLMGSGTTILLTGLALALSSLSSAAAPNYPPSDPDCQKWQKRTMTGNWVNAPNGEYWVCVLGPKSGTKVTSSSIGGGSDNNHDNGNGDSCKPGKGKGDKNHEHCGPPGQNKKN